MSMAIQNDNDILRRLENCELELQASRGYIKALEYGFHAVIGSHPASAAWQSSGPTSCRK